MTDLNPGPGVYPDVPMAEYLAWPRYSRSWLAGLVAGASPRSVQHRQTAERAETEALAFGTAFHLLVFEPVEALERIAVAPQVDRRTKAGKEAWAAFQAEAEGKLIVKADDWATMQAMAEVLQHDPAARDALDGVQDREVSFAWDEPVSVLNPDFGAGRSDVPWTGSTLPFKCRADAIDPDAQTIIDLKTTSKGISRSALSYAMQDYGYAIQAALYPRGLEAHGMEGFRFKVVWASKEPPYDVAVTELDPESLAAAERAVDWALDYLAQLDATYGDEHPWPGPCTEAGEPISLHLSGLVRRFGGNEDG